MSAENKASIEVITGEMFAGKSEEFMRRIRRAKIARQAVQVFKADKDNRYDATKVNSHNGTTEDCTIIGKSTDILRSVTHATRVVGVEEAQFLDDELPEVASYLYLRRAMRVIVAGLDMDFRGKAFGPMDSMLRIATHVVKLHAICMVCGEEASRTQRLVNGEPAYYDDPIILVGASQDYQARCQVHHETRLKGQMGDIYINPSLVKETEHGLSIIDDTTYFGEIYNKSVKS